MGIDLNSRIARGKLLELGEVDQLVDRFFWTQERLREALIAPTSLKPPKRISALESVRKSSPLVPGSTTIRAESAAIRLMYFRDFLRWKVERGLFALATTHENHRSLRDAKDFALAALQARMPKGASRSALDARQGLSADEIALLLEAVKPDFPHNPWKSEFVRVRNRLIVHLLIKLGLRKGELLGVKIRDLNLERNELTVHRRADDVEDPRSIQPNAKTAARILFVDQDLASALHAYVVRDRRKVGGAKRHPFLLVANGSGAPMSIAALDVVFTQIKQEFPGQFSRLSPHILRHTWNDGFSELMDQKGVGEAEEEDARSYMMGWQRGSGTAQTYTRRHVRKKANEASLKLQSTIAKSNKK